MTISVPTTITANIDASQKELEKDSKADEKNPNERGNFTVVSSLPSQTTDELNEHRKCVLKRHNMQVLSNGAYPHRNIFQSNGTLIQSTISFCSDNLGYNFCKLENVCVYPDK